MDTEPQDSTNGAVEPSAPASSTIDVTARDEEARASGRSRGLLIAMAVGLIAVLAMQVFTVMSTSRTDEQISALDEQVSSIRTDVSDVQESVDAVDTKVDDLTNGALVAPTASGASAAVAPSAPPGFLPQFEQGQPDAALGVVLGDVIGVEYYTDTEVMVDPTDGTARAWLIWAHWCPYCQQELPVVSDWYAENGDQYQHVELLSVTTSIDTTKGNPLEPYLDELQLPFPAIIDPDLALAQQFGANAFPFWVFTAPDGTTLLRIAGFLDVQQVEEIFGQLEALSA